MEEEEFSFGEIRYFKKIINKNNLKMNACKAISKEGLKWRCREHRSSPSDIICLDGDAKERVMCFRCLKTNSIPISNLISMSFVLAANEHDILEDYPPLKDQELSGKLRQCSIQ